MKDKKLSNTSTSPDGSKSCKKIKSDNKSKNSIKISKKNKKQPIYGLFYDDCLYHKNY